ICFSSLVCSSHASPERLEPHLELPFRAEVRRHVIPALLQRLGQVRLVRRDMSFEVVRVFVSLAVAELGHEARRGVAEMQRYGIGARLGEVVLELTEPPL